MGRKLFVGNLRFDVDEKALRELFAKAGTVSSASIVMDRETGRSRGFGFVEMSSDEEAKEAVRQFNGYDHQGRPLKVDEARPAGSPGPFRDGPPRGPGGGGFSRERTGPPVRDFRGPRPSVGVGGAGPGGAGGRSERGDPPRGRDRARGRGGKERGREDDERAKEERRQRREQKEERYEINDEDWVEE